MEDQEHRFASVWVDAPVGMVASGNLRVMFNAIYAAQNSKPSFYHGQWKLQEILWRYLRGAMNEYGKAEPASTINPLSTSINRYQRP